MGKRPEGRNFHRKTGAQPAFNFRAVTSLSARKPAATIAGLLKPYRPWANTPRAVLLFTRPNALKTFPAGRGGGGENPPQSPLWANTSGRHFL